MEFKRLVSSFVAISRTLKGKLESSVAASMISSWNWLMEKCHVYLRTKSGQFKIELL